MTVWKDKSGFGTSSYSVLMQRRHTCKGFKSGERIYRFNVVLMRRSLLYVRMFFFILGDKTDSRIGLCQKNFVF